MFTPPRSFASPAFASSYRNLELETSVAQADPHRLIEMLFDGAAAAIAQARRALRDNRIADKGAATGRALRIIEEGLKASLDPRGGELAANLRTIYEYMSVRLLSASASNDDAGYEEVENLLAPLRSAWREIGSRLRATPAESASARRQPVASAAGAMAAA